MKINDKKTKNLVHYREIVPGEVFRSEGSIFMRIEPVCGLHEDIETNYSCVSLYCGSLDHFFADDLVERLDEAELILYE